jgi:hypothetical protein
VDPRATNPRTGIPIGLSGLFQTRDLCVGRTLKTHDTGV